MVYAETDFFLALAKKEDWLKSGARKVYARHRGSISTSVVTLIEVALVAKKRGYPDIEGLFGAICKTAKLSDISLSEAMEVAHLISDEKVGVFDAFHAVLSRGEAIASSEKVYDRLGKERVPLEKN